MKAYELRSVSGLDSLTPCERAEPRPGPGQILLKMRAWSLNFRDLQVARGAYGGPPRQGLVPLSDGVGDVIETGAGVSRVKVGNRVAACFMQGWVGGNVEQQHAATALGGAIDGMLAQYVVLSAEGVVRAPAHLSDEEAASLPCAAVTAWHALVRAARVKAGDTVLLQGTGGVSMIAMQFAKLHGARCIMTSSSDEKLALAHSLGADETVNYKSRPDWDKAVLELTDGRGADVVVEVGGAGTMDKSLVAVRAGGTISLIGVLTGLAAPISTAAILRRSIRVLGIYVGSREMFEEMNRAIELHKVRPRVDKIFKFEEARAAYDYLAGATHMGKVAIRA